MTTPFPLNSSTQIAEKSILDAANKQTYLGNSFVVSSALSLADTSEGSKLTIANPSTSKKGLFFIVRTLNASALVTVRYYLNPTISVQGTPTTPVNLRPAYNNASVASARTTPTTTSNGTQITSLASGGASSRSDLLFIIDPGNTILMTAQAATGTPTCIVETIWYEI